MALYQGTPARSKKYGWCVKIIGDDAKVVDRGDQVKVLSRNGTRWWGVVTRLLWEGEDNWNKGQWCCLVRVKTTSGVKKGEYSDA